MVISLNKLFIYLLLLETKKEFSLISQFHERLNRWGYLKIAKGYLETLFAFDNIATS